MPWGVVHRWRWGRGFPARDSGGSNVRISAMCRGVGVGMNGGSFSHGSLVGPERMGTTSWILFWIDFDCGVALSTI